MVYSSPTNRGPTSYQSARHGPSDAESRFSRTLLLAVVVLGMVSYGTSFGPVADGVSAIGWNVRFAVLAALCAALSPLAGKWVPPVTAVLAAMGFLDALSNAVIVAGGWPLTAIAVLNALQAAAAVAALILAPRETGDNAAAAGYEAYVDYYNQAVQSYYRQAQNPASQEQRQGSASGQSDATAQATRRAQRVQRASQEGEYAEFDHTGSRGSAVTERDSSTSVAEQPTGLPTIGRASASADDQRAHTERAAWRSSAE